MIEIIESLYTNSKSAVLINNATGNFFNTTVGVYSTIQHILRTNHDKHSTWYQGQPYQGSGNISNLRFADDIDLISGSNKELQVLTNRLA